MIRIGTAGWSVPRAFAHRLGTEGTHLRRYASAFSCVEINSSFHRPHAQATYVKWAEATPENFRFAVKLPRTLTHDARLTRPADALDRFLDETAGLGEKRGPLLVQLPPSLAFDSRIAGRFLASLRRQYEGMVVCEPRHATWAAASATGMLVRHRIARVAADPPPAPEFAAPGGWPGLTYVRLHGSPRTYWSSYPSLCLEGLAIALRRSEASDVWCVFDNTAAGAAIENAWALQMMIKETRDVWDRGKLVHAWTGPE